MSSRSVVSSALETERRVHARRRIEGLAYVDLGPDNGAILIDLGEGGLSFHSVAPVTLDQAVLLKFKLPGSTGFIESYAEVAWLNETGKGGGLRFVELRSELREQIGAWAGTVRAAEVSATEVSSTEVGRSESSAAQASTEAQSGIDATRVDGDEAEKTCAKSETIAEAESAPTPVELAAEPVLEEVPAGISEGSVDGDGDVIAIEENETEKVLPSVETSEEQAIAAASAATLAENSEPAAPAHSDPIIKKPAGHASAPPAVEEADGVKKAGEPAARKPFRSAGNAPAKAQPVAGAPSDGVSSRVHSGIMAASAEESSVPASRVTPSTGPAATRGAARAGGTAAQPRSPIAATSGEGADRIAPGAPGASVAWGARQPQLPARRSDEWEAQGQERLPNIEETPASQALKIGIGAAAGAILVLAIVAGVPSLRTRVLATTNAKSTAAPLEAGIREFQVEVADVNNRRWILKSGGEAGSPFVDASSRRNAQPAAPDRKNAAKSERDEPDIASEAPAPEIPQHKAAKPGELVLARPLQSASAASQAENLPPSIFDGITPPIGSLVDNLRATGPNAPGPAPVEAGARGGDLQAAVLLTRVAPIYPSDALKDGLRGEVRVRATIDKDGVPTKLTGVSGDPRLIQAAFQAIRQWRYRPATLEGQPIETTTIVSIAFGLN
jgi:TonB family protein